MGESKRVVPYRVSQSGSSKVKLSGHERGVAPCAINDPWHGYRQKIVRLVPASRLWRGGSNSLVAHECSHCGFDGLGPQTVALGAGVLEGGHQLGRNGPVRTEKNPVDVQVEDGVVIRQRGAMRLALARTARSLVGFARR